MGLVFTTMHLFKYKVMDADKADACNWQCGIELKRKSV